MYKRYFAKTAIPMVILFGLSHSALAAPLELSLDDSVALALKNNQTIIIAAAGKDKARWGIEQAEAGKGFSIDYTHSDVRTNKSSTSMAPVPLYDLYSNQLALNLPVYTGGKLESTIDQAKLNFKVSDLNVDATRQQLKLNVTTSYFSVLQTSNLLDVAKQSVDDFADHLKNVQAQFKAGTVATNDVLETEVQWANAQDGLIKAKNNYALAVANLDNVIGLPLDDEIKVKDVLAYHPYPLTIADCVNYGLVNRPEMAQAQANIAVAKDQIKIAQSDYLPTVGFNLSNDWAAYNFPGAQNSNWTVGLTASLDLFDSGLTKAQIKQAEEGVTTTQAQAQQIHDNISLQIRQAYLSMKEAEERIDTSNVAVNQGAENFRITKVRYAAGVGTNLDVVDAELDLTQAKTNYVQALYDYNTCKAQLDQAMGVPVK